MGDKGANQCTQKGRTKHSAVTAAARLLRLRRRVRQKAIVTEVWAQIAAARGQRHMDAQRAEKVDGQQNHHDWPKTYPKLPKKRRVASPKPGMVPEAMGMQTEVPQQQTEAPPKTNANRKTAEPEAARTPPTASEANATDNTQASSFLGKVYTYTCPHCAATVHSRTRAGKVSVKTHCGRGFRVFDARVCRPLSSHTCPNCGANVHSAQASGRIRVRHRTPEGQVCPRISWTAHLPAQAATPPAEPIHDGDRVRNGSKTGCEENETDI